MQSEAMVRSSLEANVNKGLRFPKTRKLPSKKEGSPSAKSGQHTIHLRSAQSPVVGHVEGAEDGDEEVPRLDLVVGIHDDGRCSLPPPPLWLPQLQRLQPVRPGASACLDLEVGGTNSTTAACLHRTWAATVGLYKKNTITN